MDSRVASRQRGASEGAESSDAPRSGDPVDSIRSQNLS